MGPISNSMKRKDTHGTMGPQETKEPILVFKRASLTPGRFLVKKVSVTVGYLLSLRQQSDDCDN